MKEMLLAAQKGKYGIGFFNAVNVEMARAVIEGAEELQAPVMIGTAQVPLPAMPFERVAEYLTPMAQKASVPVCVHYDHGLSFDKCMEALKLGFTSVMYDCSKDSYEENVRKVAEMAGICHGMGVTIEGELGHVGDNEGSGKLDKPENYFTDPDIAADFAKKIGIDALAVAVGNAHGDYKLPLKLDFQRIESIVKETELPLGLHRGSGLLDDDFRMAVQRGICKINIFIDLDKTGKVGIEKGLNAGVSGMIGLISYEIEAMKEVAKEKICLFGSGKGA